MIDPPPRRRGRPPAPLSEALESARADYLDGLGRAGVSAGTRSAYGSMLRRYLHWLESSGTGGGPPTGRPARDAAILVYRSHLLDVVGAAPATVTGAVAVIADFYRRSDLGPVRTRPGDPTTGGARTLDPAERRRWLRAAAAHPTRDRTLGGLAYYAGARVVEIVRLDVDHVRLTAGAVRLYGRGNRAREVPLHPALRADLGGWLRERAGWPGAEADSALFLGPRGRRLSTQGASTVLGAISGLADLDGITARDLRHTFAATLVDGDAGWAVVAELLGTARPGEPRQAWPDLRAALDLL